MKSDQRCAMHPERLYTHGATKGSLARHLCASCAEAHEAAGWKVTPFPARIAEAARKEAMKP